MLSSTPGFMLSPTAALSPAARLASIERSVRPLPPAPAPSSYYLGDYAGADADRSFAAVLATPSGRPAILSPAALPLAASSAIFSPLPYGSTRPTCPGSPTSVSLLPSAGARAAGLEAPFASSPPSTSSLPPPTARWGAAGNSSLPTPPLSRRPTTGKLALWVARVGDEEQRLRASLRHLQAEAGVLESLVYKHRNQHHGAAYFQYLLKVRRDLKLLLGAGLAEILNAVFPVLACRKPANTILVPVKQTKKKPGANHSHYERLLGVARLLSQMAEPVMKAAIQISFLLARSFFVDLCTAVFSLLARVRVLLQQMLLDIVSVYNKITDLTDKKQAVKVTVGGVQAFREYYPSSDDTRTILECEWLKDKFVLHEKMKSSCQKTKDESQKSSGPQSSIQYETLGLIREEMENPEESNSQHKQPDAALAEQPDKINCCSSAGGSQSGRQPENEISDGLLPETLSACVPSVPHLDHRPETRKRVAFIAVGKPKVIVTTSEMKSSQVNKKQKVDMIPHTTAESGDLFRKLLDSENADKSIF